MITKKDGDLMKDSDIMVLTILVLAMSMLYVGVILHASECHNLQIKKMDEIMKVMEAKK